MQTDPIINIISLSSLQPSPVVSLRFVAAPRTVAWQAPLSMGILQARITGLLVHNSCSFFNRVYRTFGSHHFSGSLCCEGSHFYVNKIRLLFRSYCFMSVSAGNLKRVDGPFLLSLHDRWNVFQHGLCISECVSKWLVFCLPAQSTM